MCECVYEYGVVCVYHNKGLPSDTINSEAKRVSDIWWAYQRGDCGPSHIPVVLRRHEHLKHPDTVRGCVCVCVCSQYSQCSFRLFTYGGVSERLTAASKRPIFSWREGVPISFQI